VNERRTVVGGVDWPLDWPSISPRLVCPPNRGERSTRMPGIQFTKMAKYSSFRVRGISHCHCCHCRRYPRRDIIISGIEQESICIRCVSEDLVPMEVFLDFYEVEVTTGNNIAQVVQDATNNDFRFRIWLKMRYSAQKISTIFSHLRRAQCAPQVLFVYPRPLFR